MSVAVTITDLPLSDLIDLGKQYHLLFREVGHAYDSFKARLAECSTFAVDEAVIAMAIELADIELQELGIEDTSDALVYLEIDLDETYPSDHWFWEILRISVPQSFH